MNKWDKHRSLYKRGLWNATDESISSTILWSDRVSMKWSIEISIENAIRWPIEYAIWEALDE